MAGEDFTDGVGDKPISWWMFEEAASPALDGNTTNVNNLTWTGSTTRATDHMEGSFSLSVPTITDTANRTFVNLSANFPFKGATTACTIGGWVRIRDNPTSIDYLTFTNNSTEGFRIGTDATGHFRVIVYSAGGIVTLTGDTAYTVAGWHHALFRWNGTNRAGAGANGEVSLWVDGVKQSATAIRASVALVTATFTFQCRGGVPALTHQDEVFAFDVALLDTQIVDIAARGLTGLLNLPVARRRRSHAAGLAQMGAL